MKNTRTIEMLNLRPDSDQSALVPVGAPRLVAAGNWQPLGVVAGQLLIHDRCDDGVRWDLAWIPANAVDAVPELIGHIDQRPHAVIGNARRCFVTTDSGILRLVSDSDGRFRIAGTPPLWPQISITATPTTTLAENIGPCPLARLGTAVMDAYSSMHRTAVAAGRFFQPVLAAARLIDEDGNILFSTPPVLLAGPNGSNCTDALRLASPDNGLTASLSTVYADSYGISVSVDALDDALWADEVMRLEVLVSPQFHPLDPDATPSTTTTSAPPADKPVVVAMPIWPFDVCSSAASAATTLRRAVARFDDIATVAARIYHPLRTSASYPVPPASILSARDEARMLHNALRSDMIADDDGLPHDVYAFTADSVCRTGGAVVWGNSRRLEPHITHPGDFAAETAAAPWTGRICLKYRNGACSIARVSGSRMPLSFSPVIALPSPDVTEVSLDIYNDDEVVGHLTLALSPAGSHSVYIHPSRRPFTLDEGAASFPDSDASPWPANNGHGRIFVAPADHMLSPHCAVDAGGHIAALIPARNPGGGWLFGRARAYVIADDGIRMITTAPSLDSAAISLLDSRGVADAAHVADGGDAVYLLAGSSILALTRAAVATVATDIHGDFIAFDTLRNEIIVAGMDDNCATHLCADRPNRRYTTSLIARAPWLTAATHIYAPAGPGDAPGILDLASRHMDDPVTVSLILSSRFDSARVSPRSPILFPLRATHADARLTLTRHFAHGVPNAPLAAVRILGPVHSPVRMPLPPHAPAWQHYLAFAGTLSPDARILIP